MIGEQRAVRAFFRAEPFARASIEVELRACAPTTDPRSGLPVAVPPLVVLWDRERPLAVRMRSVVAVNRFPPNTSLANLLEAEAPAAGLVVQRVWEAELWRLFSLPPLPGVLS